MVMKNSFKKRYVQKQRQFQIYHWTSFQLFSTADPAFLVQSQIFKIYMNLTSMFSTIDSAAGQALQQDSSYFKYVPPH